MSGHRPRAVLVLLTALLSVSLAASPADAVAHDSTLQAFDLRAGNVTTPLAASSAPALSWKLRSGRPGARQTAYRILVATDPRLLTEKRADVWDSGKVASAGSVGVPYRGPVAAVGKRNYWTVEVWGADGGSPAAAATTWWEIGPAQPADWGGAAWITPDTGGAYAWQDFVLDIDFTIKAAAASVVFRATGPDDFLMWQVNAATTPGKVLLRPHAKSHGSFALLGETDLSAVITPQTVNAPHHLRIEARGATVVTAVDGTQVDSRTVDAVRAGTVGFRTSISQGVPEAAAFDNLAVHGLDGTPLFSDDFSSTPDARFPGATVTDGMLEPQGDPLLLAQSPDAPLLRHEFVLDKPVASARAYVYGLGFYELHLNGGKVGDQVLAPGSTPYDRRTLYDSFDVTNQVHIGRNAAGLWLGNGYGPRFSQYGFRWTGPKQGIAALVVTFADGSRRTITTDESWRWSDGPVTANDLYAGESYDARLAQDGWDRPGFDDSAWHPVRAATAPSPSLTASTAPPIRVAQTLRAVSVKQPRPGVYVYDFGQNFAGWAQLRVAGPAGTTVRMRTSEELEPDGTLDTTTNRNAASTDSYTLGPARGVQVYEPRFTYHGFRYLELTGFPGTPDLGSVAGRVVHADVAATGHVETSDPLLNTIWANNRRAVLNNSMSLPTDNPVRDERTPPGMDVQAYHDASVLDFGMDTFYGKYLLDLPPGTALPTDDGNAQLPDMGGGSVDLAWSLYEQYGDLPRLAAAYPAMKTFVDTNAAAYPGLIWPEDRGFGDWCPPDRSPNADGGQGNPSAGACFSERSLVNTALSYRQAEDVAKAARALGKTDDATHFADLATAIAAAFNAHFLDGTTYGDGRQTTSVLPLAFGIVPPDKVAGVGAKLVDTILTKDGGHLDTGIFGTRYLPEALAKAGRIDVALAVLRQKTYPGFGYEIGRGATTPWEQWTYESGMETHDHAMFAGINAAFYTQFAGITPAAPGYASIAIAPQVPAGLGHVAASIDTVRGLVASEWTQTGCRFDLTVTVPANTTATVTLPTGQRIPIGSGTSKFTAHHCA
ncbi:alpha-L-rhamnosidase (EC [Amycolatopsis camponoti]|uniref:alpha-L-rhamnosidase n=1 Tax=Amycolatopsis camponoti TaxID=2606593 RepID=A0A6I8LME6_9PSEU|nr:family 78 glycoside hydrolase catalytic domain [Amycolatopsis camponoti]VVJ17588.1 alpha-L-rhamnosidase (EC [Amycolatopsis camponoti]